MDLQGDTSALDFMYNLQETPQVSCHFQVDLMWVITLFFTCKLQLLPTDQNSQAEHWHHFHQLHRFPIKKSFPSQVIFIRTGQAANLYLHILPPFLHFWSASDCNSSWTMLPYKIQAWVQCLRWGLNAHFASPLLPSSWRVNPSNFISSYISGTLSNFLP